MEVTKTLKFQNEQFGSRGVSIAVTHSELGLSPPASIDELYQAYQTLSYHSEALLLLEEVKLGRVHPNQLREKLRNWLPKDFVVDFRTSVNE
jgi:hypothetical protein